MKMSAVLLISCLFVCTSSSLADTQVAQLRLSLDSAAVIGMDAKNPDRALFLDIPAKLTLTFTVAALPSTKVQTLDGVSLDGDVESSVEWQLTREGGDAVKGFAPRMLAASPSSRIRHVGVGQHVTAVFAMPPLPVGEYTLTARLLGVESGRQRFVVSAGTESLPLRLSYASLQAERARDATTRVHWLTEVGRLDPTNARAWIQIGDDALQRLDYSIAESSYQEAVRALRARRVRFKDANSEFLSEVDRLREIFERVTAALEETKFPESQMAVRISLSPEKHYELADRKSGRTIRRLD